VIFRPSAVEYSAATPSDPPILAQSDRKPSRRGLLGLPERSRQPLPHHGQRQGTRALSPNGRRTVSCVLIDCAAKLMNKGFSRNTVGRTRRTGSRDQFSTCSARKCSSCRAESVMSAVSFFDTVICEMFTDTSKSPGSRAAAAQADSRGGNRPRRTRRQSHASERRPQPRHLSRAAPLPVRLRDGRERGPVSRVDEEVHNSATHTAYRPVSAGDQNRALGTDAQFGNPPARRPPQLLS
jgi:hypothetical protein